jgi:two-component system KDP operon response regulator KdpE
MPGWGCSVNALVVGSGGGVAENIDAALRLGWAGIDIVRARTGRQALEYVQKFFPDLVAIDTALPDNDWLHLLRETRRLSGAVVVALYRQFDEGELMAAVEAGADDYLQVPVNLTLFVARTRAALRRAHRFAHGEEGVATYGDLKVDVARHEARVNGECLKVTATEFKILLYMARRGGRVATTESLRNLIWGEDAEVYGPCLRKYIQNLRRKLQEILDCKTSIVTLPKVGYKLVSSHSDIPVGSVLAK